MTWDKAAEFVDAIVSIAKNEIERGALDSDHWEHADTLAARISKQRDQAIEILMGVPDHG